VGSALAADVLAAGYSRCVDRFSALAATLVLEAPAGALGAWLARAPRHVAFGAVAAVAGSLLTNPIVYELDVRWALDGDAAHYGGSVVDWAWKIALLEGGAVVVEAVGYLLLCKLSWQRALAVSAAVNAWSFGVGLALQALGFT
jgi:hypothetical protein